MPDYGSIGPLPPIIRNPTMLSAIVRKRLRRIVSRPIGWPFLPDAATPDDPESMEALQEEIIAARPILDNLHEDLDIFAVRDAALDEILHALVRMSDRLRTADAESGELDALREDIEALIEQIGLVAESARRRSVPLLRPFERVSVSPGQVAPPSAAVEMLFFIPRAERLTRDIEMLSRYVQEIALELKNRGLSARFGLVAVGRESYPFPLRESHDDFSLDMKSIVWANEPENMLQAIQDSFVSFLFRPGAQKVYVVFSDMDSPDDLGGMREETIGMLQSENVTLFAMSVCDQFTRRPFPLYTELAAATGGRYFNIDLVPYDVLIGNFMTDALKRLMERVPRASIDEREIPLGPGVDDNLTVRLPDFRPVALGIDTLPLETQGDFVAALRKIESVLFFTSTDRAEKNTLRGFLYRVLDHFHHTRNNWLNFWV